MFIAGAWRKFIMMDFYEPYLFDQHFGIAVKAIDPDNRITYTSLPFLAMKEQKELEMRSEEMRVLYVAMTRAKEHLEIIASVKDIEKTIGKWQDAQLIDPELMLPEYTRSRANGYLDWIGPAVARHQAFAKFGGIPGGQLMDDPSVWQIDAFPSSSMLTEIEETTVESDETVGTLVFEEVDADLLAEVKRRFDTKYLFEASVLKKSKQTVSELKRLAILEQRADDLAVVESEEVSKAYLHDRPAFMQLRALSPAEIGTAMHTIMQHITIEKACTVADIEQLVAELTTRQLLTAEEATMIDVESVATFFQLPIAKRLQNAKQVSRELPFTYAQSDADGDHQILQGIADCLFEEQDGWVLLDYKTDKVRGRYSSEEDVDAEMQQRYGIQLNLYKKAIEAILKIDIKEMVLYLFDGQRTVTIQEE